MANADDTTQEARFPLSSVATPPSIKHSSFDSPRPSSWLEGAFKHKLPDVTPRKRSVASDEGVPMSINTSFKRARKEAMDDQPTAFPSPSPTPINLSYQQNTLLDALPSAAASAGSSQINTHSSPLHPSHLHPHLPNSQSEAMKNETSMHDLIDSQIMAIRTPPASSASTSNAMMLATPSPRIQQQQQQQQQLQSLPLQTQPQSQPQPQQQQQQQHHLLHALQQLPALVDHYDTLTDDQKTYVLFQLLKRSSKKSLKFVNSIIVPALKRDFLASLPRELGLHVISFLDARSLCRAAMVSRTWRHLIEQDYSTWRALIYKDGLKDPTESPEVPPARRRRLLLAPPPPPPPSSAMEDDEDKDDQAEPMDIDGAEELVLPGAYPVQRDKQDDDDHDEQDEVEEDEQEQGDEEALEEMNPYKEDYRRRHLLRRNWQQGKFKRVRFRSHYTHPSQNVVTCLQFDDDKVISGMDDRMINIFDTKTGRHLRTLRGHEGGVWALQYIGNTLVSGSTDRTIRVWDIASGNCTHVFLGHTSTVRCLEIVMPKLIDGRMQPAEPLIVTGSRDFTLRVWRLPDPTKDQPFYGTGVNPWYRHTLTGHADSVRAITAHGTTLVSGSYDNTVGVWNLETGQQIHRMEGHTQKVYTVVIDPDRNRCMSGSMDGAVRIWDLVTGHCLEVLQGHTILVGLLGLSTDYLVSAAADSTLRVWHPETGICRHVLTGHQAAITCFQHDNDKIISGAEGGLKMWDIKTGRHIADLITGVDNVWRVAFDKHRCVAAVCKDEITTFEVLDFSVDE